MPSLEKLIRHKLFLFASLYFHFGFMVQKEEMTSIPEACIYPAYLHT